MAVSGQAEPFVRETGIKSTNYHDIGWSGSLYYGGSCLGIVGLSGELLIRLLVQQSPCKVSITPYPLPPRGPQRNVKATIYTTKMANLANATGNSEYPRYNSVQ